LDKKWENVFHKKYTIFSDRGFGQHGALQKLRDIVWRHTNFVYLSIFTKIGGVLERELT